MQETIYSVGHSTQPIEQFVTLLRRHGITAVADVRSMPRSKMNPQFNAKPLEVSLRGNGIEYVSLGKELGARTADRSCYLYGKLQYDRLAQTVGFNSGLERVREGARKYRIVLMCAEKEPLECHRTILVSRHLVAGGSDVAHIHIDGRVESHDNAMARLVRLLNLPEDHMFASREDIVSEAYRLQGERIAYAEEMSVDESVESVAQ